MSTDETTVAEPDAAPGGAVDGAGAPPEEAPAPSQPLSLEEAFERASAASEPPADSGVQDPPKDGAKPADDPAPGAAGKPQELVAAKPASDSQALDRIHEAIRTGRVDALEPELRGRAKAIVAETVRQHVEETQTMSGLHDLFLQLEATRQEDPEEFNRLMWNDAQSADRRAFYDEYRREYPNVTLETPDARQVAPTPEAVKHTTAVEIFNDLDQAVGAMAKEAGIAPARVAELRSGAQGPWGYLSSVYTEAVNTAAEAKRAQIRAEERQAAGLEAQAAYSGKTIITPRVMGDAASKGKRDPKAPFSMEEAMQTALANR